MTVDIERIDHIVLTVHDVEATCRFYEQALGLRAMTFAGGRRSLQVGEQKINLHQAGAELSPHAAAPTPGGGDLCLTTRTPLEQVAAHLEGLAITIEHGPVRKQGARSALWSLYLRDLDGNLVEVSNELEAGQA